MEHHFQCTKCNKQWGSMKNKVMPEKKYQPCPWCGTKTFEGGDIDAKENNQS